MKKGSLRSKKEGNWSILPEPPRQGVETHALARSSTPRHEHQRLGVAQQASSTPKGNQDKQQFFFDPKIERTLRKLKKQTKASRQLNFEEVEENNMVVDPRRTLGDYTIPSTAGCGSS
ncbi:hypothetical protein PIB30_071793 [Stylosanthes scabra]|uniref:Uncharacterized protein n=1 Tax=Stylosanthes scabra TaxID=79078 RepID=A0ABU6WM85_9FABA|nr:hypothetical protein [Stylosanthes scabra]